MKGFKIIWPGLMTSIQDLGRSGLSHFAIPPSGVMDRNSALLANRLLQNPDNYPLIENTLLGGSFEVLNRIQIAITGADMTWVVNGYPIQLNRVYTLEKGDLLEGSRVVEGFRSYIGVSGKLLGNEVYGSVSYLSYAGIGNLDGSPLKKGDIIELTSGEKFESPLVSPTPLSNAILLEKGPEFDYLDQASQQRLYRQAFTISPKSNRMGAQLDGEPLVLTKTLKDSLPLYPGFVQLPSSGHPIVVLQDGQTTGGYPRIAYIKEEVLDRFNQIPIGGKLRCL